MLDVLAGLTTGIATNAIYEVLLQLFERKRMGKSHARERERLEKLEQYLTGVPGAQTDEVRHVVEVVLREIENTEGKQFSELSEEEVRRYTTMLARLLEQKVASQLQYDETKGRKLLEALRQEYVDIG